MSDVLEPNDDIEADIEADEPEPAGEYRPTRGTLAHEDDPEHETEDAPEPVSDEPEQ